MRATHRRVNVALGAGLVAVAFLAAACGSSSSSAPPTTAAGAPGSTGGAGTTPRSASAAVYPGASWQKTDAATAGFDQAKLDEIAARAKAGGSNCLLVVKDGKIVDERYWNDTKADTTQEVFSATKSYTSALVGIAQDEGKLKISDKASTYIPEWVGTPSADVTVENLLKNDSGRHYDFNTDYVDMAVGAADKTAFAVALGQDAPPGTVWKYNNSAIQTLSGVLEKATGVEASEYAQQKLLAPIGMKDSVMKKDPSGGTLTFMGLSSTCQDMARFGQLMLHKGSWDGKQVVSEAYVDASTGTSSQDLNAAYGYLWWLNRKGRMPDSDQATSGAAGGDKIGQMVPGAPDDMFWALGLGGQFIQVDPGTNTVVVRLAPVNLPAGSGKFTQKDTAEVVTQALKK